MTTTSVPATAEQLRVLRHMLGIDKRERCKPYRDHHCANAGDEKLAEMARAGLVRLAQRPTTSLPYDTYVTTSRGRELAIESQRAMLPSRAQQRYHDFLCARDASPDLTFREFLAHRSTSGSDARGSEGGT